MRARISRFAGGGWTDKMTWGNISRRGLFKMGARVMLAGVLGKGIYNTSSRQIEAARSSIMLENLPETFKGFKIAFLTDLHASFIANNSLYEAAGRIVREFAPDIIAFGGDFITGSTKFLSGSVGGFDPKHLNECVEAFGNLSAPHGVYCVLGNHDCWGGAQEREVVIKTLADRFGAVWLRNQSVRISKGGGTIHLLGVDDYWEDTCSLPKAYGRLPKKDVKILLSHNPDINAEIFPAMGVDLVLAGHTHGGQVRLPIIGMPLLPSKFGQKYLSGAVRDGKRTTYVSRGIGHLLAPVRINCDPEVTLITLA